MLFPNIHLHLDGAETAERIRNEAAKDKKLAEVALDLKAVETASARFQSHYMKMQSSDHTIPKDFRKN